MKTRILTFTCILILLLTFTSADAALVMGTPYQGESSVSGIQGLQIDVFFPPRDPALDNVHG